MSYERQIKDDAKARKQRLFHSAPPSKPAPAQIVPRPAPPQPAPEESPTDETASSAEPFAQPITTSLIVKTVADFYGISQSDIFSKRRMANLVRQRHVAMYLAKELTRRSLPDIGRRMGGRDHSTIFHACQRIAAFRATDAALNSEIEQIIEQLYPGYVRPKQQETAEFIPAFLPLRAA